MCSVVLTFISIFISSSSWAAFRFLSKRPGQHGIRAPFLNINHPLIFLPSSMNSRTATRRSNIHAIINTAISHELRPGECDLQINPVLNPPDAACNPAETQTQSSRTTFTPVNNLDTLYANLLNPLASVLPITLLRIQLFFILSSNLLMSSPPSRAGSSFQARSMWNRNA